VTHRLSFNTWQRVGWLTYIGLRAQKLGSSLEAVFTLAEPPDLHPWLQVVQPEQCSVNTLETLLHQFYLAGRGSLAA